MEMQNNHLLLKEYHQKTSMFTKLNLLNYSIFVNSEYVKIR